MTMMLTGNLRSRTGSVTSLNEMSQYTPTHAAAAAPNRPYSVQAPRPPSLTPQHTVSTLSFEKLYYLGPICTFPFS